MKPGRLTYERGLQMKKGSDREVVVDRDEDDCNESSTKSRRVRGETPSTPKGLHCDAVQARKRSP